MLHFIEPSCACRQSCSELFLRLTSSEISKKIKIVREDEEEEEEAPRPADVSLAGFDKFLTEEEVLEVKPYQRLLDEFGALNREPKSEPKKASKQSKKEAKAARSNTKPVRDKETSEDETDEAEGEGEDEIQFETYAQEVLCKDNLESEDVKKNGWHFIFFSAWSSLVT